MHARPTAATLAALLAAGVLAACSDSAPEVDAATAENVKQTVREHIAGKQSGKRSGKAAFEHPRTGEDLEMSFDYVHDHVKQSEGGRYFVCVDYRGQDDTVYDVDYYLDESEGGLAIEDEVLHKIGDQNVISDARRQRLNESG